MMPLRHEIIIEISETSLGASMENKNFSGYNREYIGSVNFSSLLKPTDTEALIKAFLQSLAPRVVRVLGEYTEEKLKEEKILKGEKS